MNDPSSSNRSQLAGFAVALVVLLFSIVSILCTNQYKYGISDHSITIPFLKSYINPSLYPNDYLLTQRLYYYTYFWNALGMISEHLGTSLPILFFIVYFISIYMTFLGVYMLAMALFKKRDVAFLSLFFLLFAKKTLADMSTIESVLMTRVTVLPVLLFSIYFLFKEKYLLSFSLQGIGFLIHPLTTVFVLAAIFTSSVINLQSIGIRKLLLCLATFLVLACPIFAWKILHSPDSLSLFHADPKWVELLRLRSTHHTFPFSWNTDLFFQAGLLLFIFFISWKFLPKPNHHKTVLIFTGIILLACAFGTIFSEYIPLSIVLTLQPLRSFQLLFFLVIIYFSSYFLAEMQRDKNVVNKIVAVLASVCILYGAEYWKLAYIAFIALSILLFIYHLMRRKTLPLNYFVSALVIIALSSGIGAYVKKGGFTINNVQEKSWLDIQLWAKQNTSPNDMFITPPQIEGFRVESERAIYGDWKDGCLLNFNPAFGYEWLRRVLQLGYKRGGFMNLSEPDFDNIADEMTKGSPDVGSIFLVMFKAKGKLNFPVMYGNERFFVYKIR